MGVWTATTPGDSLAGGSPVPRRHLLREWEGRRCSSHPQGDNTLVTQWQQVYPCQIAEMLPIFCRVWCGVLPTDWAIFPPQVGEGTGPRATPP